ncbi:bifunctional transcriptional activator/DNA repair enzyme AdaA [Lapidilactobacillus wuchangensis]|uniref:bifunctional transcriptional activator/DNA repair enzyme AdaA n=1 Tax=Lapidilactobacillus wuchangensis TaxID=2486001 RepID=UPI000F77A3D7|nr:Ada metal-binding domain-containing protein [Lapidilactobacillus wuchangensis]
MVASSNQLIRPTDQQWQAIVANDRQADDQFWYGVTSTLIFCRPSCASRLPKREHIRIFADPNAALAAGFRPCKRCRPTAELVSNQTWVLEIDQVLQHHYAEKLDLNELAKQVHGSESYLRHVYQQLTGQTPQQKLTQIRLERAQLLLATTNSTIASIGRQVGWANPAYFIKIFRQQIGLTPRQYRQQFLSV